MPTGRRYLKSYPVVIDQELNSDIKIIFVQNSQNLKSDDVNDWHLPNKIPGCHWFHSVSACLCNVIAHLDAFQSCFFPLVIACFSLSKQGTQCAHQTIHFNFQTSSLLEADVFSGICVNLVIQNFEFVTGM